MDFALLAGDKMVMKGSEKIKLHLDLGRELRKLWNIRLCARNGPQSLEKDTRRIGNQKKNREHLNCSIVEIGLNTESKP